MKKSIFLFVLILVSVVNVNAQKNDSSMSERAMDNRSTTMNDNKNAKNEMQTANKGMMPDVSNWPEASRMAVEEITGKYGNQTQLQLMN